jgi:hypothetical protein
MFAFFFAILESASTGRTPASSNQVSYPSFDTRQAMIMDMVVAPQNHQQAKANVSDARSGNSE